MMKSAMVNYQRRSQQWLITNEEVRYGKLPIKKSAKGIYQEEKSATVSYQRRSQQQ